MSRYIKLEDLQKFPIRIDHYDKENGNEHFVYGVETVLEYAEHLPTVDVVEVVRCKDCIYYKSNSCFNRQWNLESSTEIPFVGENDFCSYGERSEK